MDKKKLIIGMVILLIPLVLATTDEIRFIAEQNTALDITEPCFNNDTYCSSASKCNITIKDPSQQVVINNLEMTNQGAYHNYTLNSYHLNNTGVYESSVICKDGIYNGYDNFYFKVTPNGQELSLVQGIIYVILLIMLMILIILTILGAYSLDGKNKYDFGGKLVKINVNKYIKIGLFFMSYLFLIVIFLFCKIIARQFLVISFAEGIFHVLLILSAIGLFPIFLGTLVLWFLRIIADFYVYKLKKRGLKPR